MERIEGMISDIVFKNEDNGYTIAHLANSDNEIVIVGCMPTALPYTTPLQLLCNRFFRFFRKNRNI